MVDKEILTVKEAADVAGVGVRTIRYWIKIKRLPTRRTRDGGTKGTPHLINRRDLVTAAAPPQLAAYEAKEST